MRFGILGPVTAWTADGTAQVGGPREHRLLAALLLSPNRRVTVDRLMSVLWADQPPATARDQVHNSVRLLRRNLDVDLTWDGGGFVLAVVPDDLDASRFERWVRAAVELPDAEAAALLRRALDLWRGAALSGLDSRELGAEARRLDEQRLTCLERRIDLDLALGRDQELVAELRALVAEHPLRERLHALLMRALYRSGRQAEALTTYREARALLVEELGIEPGAELAELEQAILRSDPSLRPPVTSTVPQQLPVDVVGFTGRAAALARLDAADANLVLVTGSAGVGKTALAVHWAHRVRDRFPDGRLHVDLRGYSASPPVTPAEALGRFLRALGTPAERVPRDVDEAAGLYRSLLADRRVLVVLDNAATSAQVRPLLPGGPGCLVVATSRDRLGGLVKDGAVRVPLHVLEEAESRALLVRVLGADRVAAEPDASAELAALCGHLPLALRIAAALVVDNDFASVAEQVDALRRDRLAGLDGDEDDGVRSAFDLSYAKLGTAAQELFGLLSVVPGPDFTPEACAALTGTLALDQLVAAHLVHRTAPGRFACHDLLRAYARDVVQGRDLAAPRQRLFDFYLRHLDAAARLVFPERFRLPVPDGSAEFADADTALEWLDAEQPNLVAATLQATGETAWLLADTLHGYAVMRRGSVDWLAVARAGVAAAETAGDAAALAATRRNLAAVHVFAGDYTEAEREYSAALEHSDPAAEADTLNRLGVLRWETGRLREAVEVLERSLAIDDELGRVAGQANTLNVLGIVHWQLGGYLAAAPYFQRALALFRGLGAKVGEAAAMTNLGGVYVELRRHDEALDLLTAALAANRVVDNRSVEAVALIELALLHRNSGRYAAALETGQQAAALTEDVVAHHRLHIDVLNLLGAVHTSLGRYGQATEHFRRALDRVSAEVHYSGGRAQALIGLAEVALATGLLDEAERRATAALRTARESGYLSQEGHALTTLAATALAAGRHDEAAGFATRARDVHLETGHRLGQERAWRLLDATRSPSRRMVNG
jgi:DNA-binding SARP family transcriptional activator/Tfp pilus assembly protein PilF